MIEVHIHIPLSLHDAIITEFKFYYVSLLENNSVHLHDITLQSGATSKTEISIPTFVELNRFKYI